MSYNTEAAPLYEGQNEHALPGEEASIWLALATALAAPQALSGKVLDIGAGTGLLTSVLKGAGLTVTGLEPSRAMIEQGLRKNAGLAVADFVLGSAEDGGLFPRGHFDWIVSRQVLCHLTDADRSFGAWHRWLKPGGHVILVDGFWNWSGWSETALAAQPFAALTSAEPVAEALARAGFGILRAGKFNELNAARHSVFGENATRYVVVALKR